MNLLSSLHQSLIYDRRVRRLADILSKIIPPNSNVLDVGAGDGKLEWSLLQRRPDLRFEGIDVLKREREWMPVKSFDGVELPYHDLSFDGVMLVDVLHHAADSFVLLQEACRVSRRWLLVKDHFRTGFAAEARLRMMDYAGNSGYGVAMPYNYFSPDEWKKVLQTLGLEPQRVETDLNLYGWPLDLIFGAGLHFVGIYRKPEVEPVPRN